MKRCAFIFALLYTCTSYSQINKFGLDCTQDFIVTYGTGLNETKDLKFMWSVNKNLIVSPIVSQTLIDKNGLIIIEKVIEIIDGINGFKTSSSEYNNFKFTDIAKTNIQYSLNKSFIKKSIIDFNNNLLVELYNSLSNELTKDGLTLCSQSQFSTRIKNNIKDFEKEIIVENIKGNSYKNKNIKPINKASYKKNDPLPHYNHDTRNPIAFTRFIVRNPRTNGENVINNIGNYSSYHYIRPTSIVNIIFDKEVYEDLNSPKLTIKAYLKRKNGTVVPVNVSGFYEIKEDTNTEEFEKNPLIEEDGKSILKYNYDITTIKNSAIQTEINTSIENPQPEDKLIVTILNASDGNVSFTTTFEYENYGWEQSASGGFSWINSRGQNGNLRPAGSSGVSFYYKFEKGAEFWKHFFIPSFGPELIVLQGRDNTSTSVGLGVSVSTFLRTFKVGAGWFLTGENGKPYFSIGVNFVEGYKSLSEILDRSRD